MIPKLLLKMLLKALENGKWQILLLKALQAVPWETLLLKLLLKIAAVINEETGISIDVLKLDRGKLINALEEVLSDLLNLDLDINNDGQVGDGKEG